LLLRLIIVSILCCQFGPQLFAQSLIDRVENSPYPSTSQSDTLYVFNDDLFTHDELLLLQSIQGLCAKIEPKIYRDKGSGSAIWIQDLEDNYNVFVSSEMDGSIDSVLTLVPSHVQGYILCNLNDNSSNVANSLCGPLNALAVTTDLQPLVEQYGFPMIMDVRDKDEQWVIDNYSEYLSDMIVTYQREDKSLFLGDYSIFSHALHFYDDIHSTTTENAFSRMASNSILYGWGDDEYQTIAKASAYSIGVHPADWGFNISTLTNFNAETTQQVSTQQSSIEENTHTVCFLMSDGDNVQWMLNLFAEDSRWFGSENRGLMDIGWTIPPALSEIAPTVMAKLYDMAASTASGKDYFVAGPSGHTYHFPELYPALESSCALMNSYLEKSDLSIVNILGNAYDEPLFHSYLKQESVDGLFYYDYSNYSKMQGKMDCYALKPVISAKYNLWGGFESCESLASKLNDEVKDPYSTDGYSLIAVHAWSNSVDSLLLVRSLLNEGIRVVAPDEFVALISEAICAPKISDVLSLEAYPNPFSNEIKLRIRGYLADDFSLYIEDLKGKRIPFKSEEIETLDGWVSDIYIHSANGVYFIHFDSGTEKQVVKVLKCN
jgi:hypothetical protein|tara:strand:+ start:45094 stop:46905 length:1812 start_codon:yes stop_codon:yes gene_type:complete